MSTKTKVTKINELMNSIKDDGKTSVIHLNNLEEQIARFEGVIEFTNVISRTVDYKKIHKMSCSKIRDIIGCENVLIYQFNEETKELFYENSKEKIKLSISENNFAGACAQYKATLLIDNAPSDQRMKNEPGFHFRYQMKNLILSPLVSSGEIRGVIVGINKVDDDKFHKDDVYFLEAIANQMTIALDNIRLFEQHQKQFLQVCEALADAIGKKDRYTGGHTKRVSVFSEMIAQEMNLSFDEMNDLKLSAVLHDIGKIGIEDKILKKASPLTQEEFAIMRDHPRHGYEILKHIDSLKNVIDGMRFHHERPDGKGYPFGLKGNEIPVIANIISVADTFDAMISTRPYRKGLPPMVAYEEILKNSGTQFDSVVVEAFARAFRKTRMYKAEEDHFNLQVYKKTG
jgi:HD-GYP domain-containing protein (c-di-GMP phosphodiesterase class II)